MAQKIDYQKKNPIKYLRFLTYLNEKTISYKHLKNRAASTYSYFNKESICRGFPTKIHIELTNICNLNCIMCPRMLMKRERGLMDFSLFKKIIDELRDNAEFAYLHLFGESLLHPDFFRMVKYCKNSNISTGLATNATLLNQKKSLELIDSNLDYLVISFDGVNKESYEKIRQGGNFEQTLNNIETFLRVKSSHPHTAIQLIYMKNTSDKVDEFVNFWKEFNVDSIRVKPFQTWSGELDAINKLSTSSNELPPSETCDRLWRHLCILWDGTVVPCEFDFDKIYPLGNVRNESIAEIWNGELMVELRKQHLSKKRIETNLCKSCTYKSPSTLENLAFILLDSMTITKITSDLGR